VKLTNTALTFIFFIHAAYYDPAAIAGSMRA
jgi:hypothetical protein